MKKMFNAFVMTQSMFCSLPFPCKRWDEEARPYMLLFLPVIGLEVGLMWLLAHFALQYFELPKMVYGLIMCAVPYLVSGFIHLDGFLDVTDAISSWRPLEKRRAILKDSQVGAFAVIWCVFLMLAGFACFFNSFVCYSGRYRICPYIFYFIIYFFFFQYFFYFFYNLV